MKQAGRARGTALRSSAIVAGLGGILMLVAVQSAVAEPVEGPTAPAADRPAVVDSHIVNFDARGGQVIKPDVDGNDVDAHDGEIARFGQRYWLYGTSYDCGYGLLQSGTRFCGFKAYSSSDLVHWVDEGQLFDSSTAQWQSRCAPPRFGCYRPHVVFNARTGKYVMWVNTYDNVSNYHVFTADSPGGPFVEGPEPQLSINHDAPAGNLNNGDEDVFVDRDGTAYLVLTDIVHGHRLKIERLDPTYTTGTGDVSDLGVTNTEAPSMFTRAGRYYVAYSDPTCAYCSSTGTSYVVSDSPLGPWRGAGTTPDSWSITDADMLHVTGGGIGLSQAGASWTDYTLAADVTPLQTAVQNGISYAQAGLMVRMSDAGSGYGFLLSNYPYTSPAQPGYITFVKFAGGGAASVQPTALPFAVTGGTTYHVAVTASGSKLTVTINGTTVDTVNDPDYTHGSVGFRESNPENEQGVFDNVRVTAPDGSVLLADDFSRDLSQWARPAPELQGFKINPTSCGGQPSFVSEVPTTGGTAYLFGSDLWNGRPNQALAGYFWHPLTFAADGSIAPYSCDATVDLELTAGSPGFDHVSPQRDANSANGLFRPFADGSPAFKRAQTFTVGRDGSLREVRVTTFQTGSPDAPLVLELTRLNADGSPGPVLAQREVPASEVGWSPRTVALTTNVAVSTGEQYAIVMRTSASRGAYGWAYDDANPYAGGGEWYAPTGDAAWRPEAGRDLRFETFVTGSGA